MQEKKEISLLDPRIRLRHLNCFIETSKQGSLTGAAKALKISQPAASKTIRELETVLGCPLFDRSGRQLSLNPAGKVFQERVTAGLNELAHAQIEVRRLAAGRGLSD